MSLRDVWQWWRTFWFAPEAPLSLCVFRIGFGLVVVLHCLLMIPDLLDLFGVHAIASAETSKQSLSQFGPPGLDLFVVLPPGDGTVVVLFLVMSVAAIALTVGYRTRTSCFLVYLLLASFQQRNSLVIHGGDILIKMVAFIMIFSPAGACLSLDAKKFGMRGWMGHALSSAYSGWPQRLLRFQTALVYFQAFWSKLEDKTWLDGSAIFYVLHQYEFLRFPIPWISENLWFCQTLTWGTLMVEAGMWSLIWFKETRYYVLAAALILHLGMEYTMNLSTFEWMMIMSLLLFVPSNDMVTALQRIRDFVSRCRSDLRRVSSGSTA